MTTKFIYGTEAEISVDDIEERIEELKDQRDNTEPHEWEELYEANELEYLTHAFHQINGEGETLIHNREWNHYITEQWQQSVEDMHLPDIIKNNINWQGVVEDAQADYTEIDVDGQTYWLV